MNPKLLLCLALVLSCGLFGCSTTAHRADGTVTNAPLQIRFIEPWTNITIRLVVPGSSALNAIKSKTVEVQARQAVYEFVPKPDPLAGRKMTNYYLFIHPWKFLVVHDPFTKKFCFVGQGADFFVSDSSGMKGYGYSSGTISPTGVSIEFADSKLDYDTAIAQFEKTIDINGIIDMKRIIDLDIHDYETAVSTMINFGNAFCSFDLSDEHPPVVEGIDITDDIMRLDFRETASTKKTASVWLNLQTKKAIRSVEDGQEMKLGRDGRGAIPLVPKP